MNEVTRDLRIIELFGGVQIAVEKDRVDSMLAQIKTGAKYIDLGNGEGFMTSAVAHWLRAARHEDNTRRKNGGWQCASGNWHDKNEKCDCTTRERKAYLEEREVAIFKCGKCRDGWITNPVTLAMTECECVMGIKKPL